MFEEPFRWDIKVRSRLGSLALGPRAESYPGFTDDLLSCCSRVVAFGGDSDLVFIGRSPESIFDILSGLMDDTSWQERLTLLHLSMSFSSESEIRKDFPGAISAMRDYFCKLHLDPEQLARRERPVAFVDLVYSGGTFGNLIRFLANWTRELHFDWGAVSRKIRLVGITIQTQTSPKTWRWQQHADWVKLLGTRSIKNVSTPLELWSYLGNDQQKVSLSYTAARWGDPEASKPSYTQAQLEALRLALDLFEHGRKQEIRSKFANKLAREPAMKEKWFKDLVSELRKR